MDVIRIFSNRYFKLVHLLESYYQIDEDIQSAEFSSPNEMHKNHTTLVCAVSSVTMRFTEQRQQGREYKLTFYPNELHSHNTTRVFTSQSYHSIELELGTRVLKPEKVHQESYLCEIKE